jgi:flagellin-like protein
MLSKKGLSGIVTVVILIALVIAAVSIVWAVVAGLLESSQDSISSGLSRVSLKITNVSFDSSGAHIRVLRNVGEGNLVKIKFIFITDTKRSSSDTEVNLNILDETIFNIPLPTGISRINVKEIAIAPIIQTEAGKEVVGEIVDSYDDFPEQVVGVAPPVTIILPD